MSLESVSRFFSARGMAERVLVFDTSSATVELAAQAVGCAPQKIIKTLSFKSPDATGCLLVACAGDARIDNVKFKNRFGIKASMLKSDEAVELTGHAVGGVCPFVVKEGAKIYLDESIKRFDAVYPAAGSANSAVRLTPGELSELTGGEWVDVCKDWAGDAV